MYSFKVPLQAVFLATTFVTVVFATPIYVPIRRDPQLTTDSNAVPDLRSGLAQLGVSAQLVTLDIQNLSPTTNQSAVQAFFDDFSDFSSKLGELVGVANSFNLTGDQTDTQTLINDFLVPVFASINVTGTALNQQANTIIALSNTFGNTIFLNISNFSTNFDQSFQATTVGLTDLSTAVNANFNENALQTPELRRFNLDLTRTFTAAIDALQSLA